MSNPAFFTGVRAVILDQGLGKARAQILGKQLEGKGGQVERTLSKRTTHIVVGSNVRLARVPHLLKVESIPESVTVVRADWLSACLVKGEKIDLAPYVARPENSTPSPADSAKLLNFTPTKPLSGLSQPPGKSSKPELSEGVGRAAEAMSPLSDAEKNVTPDVQQKPNVTASPQKVTCLQAHAKFLVAYSW